VNHTELHWRATPTAGNVSIWIPKDGEAIKGYNGPKVFHDTLFEVQVEGEREENPNYRQRIFEYLLKADRFALLNIKPHMFLVRALRTPTRVLIDACKSARVPYVIALSYAMKQK